MRYTFDELIQEQQEEYELEVLYQLSNYLVKEVIMEQYVLEEDTTPPETADAQNQQPSQSEQPSSSTPTSTPTSEPPAPTNGEQQPQTGDAQSQQNPSLLDKIIGVIKRIFGAIFGFFGKIIGWVKGLFTRGKNVEMKDPTPEDEQQEASEETPQQFPTENANDPEANAEITEDDIAQIFTQNENTNVDGSQASPNGQQNPNQLPNPNDQNQQPDQNQNGEFNRSTPLDVQSLRESTDQLDADVAKKKSTVGGLLDSLKQTFGIGSDNNGDAQAGNDANQPNNPNQSGGGNAQQTSQEMQSKLSQVEQQFSQLEQQLNSGNLSEEDQQSLSQQLNELRSDLSSVKEMTNGKVPQKLPALAALSPTATVNWYMKHDPEGLDLYIQSLDKRTEILKKQQEFSALKKSAAQKIPNLLGPLRELQDNLFGQGRIDRANANAQVAEAKQKAAEAKLGQKTAEANMRTVNAQANQKEAEARLAQTQANAKRNNINSSFVDPTPANGFHPVGRFLDRILGNGVYANTGSSGGGSKGDAHTYNINYTGLPGGAPPPGTPPASGSPTPTPTPSGLDPSDPTVAALISQLTDIQTKVTNAETKLSDIETKVDDVESKVDSVETKVDDVNKDLTRVNAKQNQILSNVKTKFQQLSSSMAGVRKDIKDARKSISGQIRDAERSTNDNIENAVHTLNANDTALSSQINKAKQATLDALTAAKAELEQKFSEDLTQAKSDINDNMTTTADALATNIKNTATKINANINNVNTNVNNLQQSLDDHMGYRAGAEADIQNQLETLANDQHERMGAMKQQLNGLQQGQQELNNKMDQANVTQQQMLTNITSAIQSGQRKTEDLVNQITQLNDQVKQLTETVQQNASAKQELIDKLTSQMNQVSEDQKKAYEDRINQLKEEVKQIVDSSNIASSTATLERFSEIIELAKQNAMTNPDENMKSVLQQIVNSTESLSQNINSETITQANRVIDEIKNMNQKNEQPIITQATNPNFDPNNTKKLIYKSQLPVKIQNKFKNIRFKLEQKPDDPTTYDIVIYEILVPYAGCLNNVTAAYELFIQYAMKVFHTDVNGITQMGSNYATNFSNIPTNVTESAQMNGTRSLNDLQRDIIKLLTLPQDQPLKWIRSSEFNEIANRLLQLDQQSKQLQTAFSQILKGLEMEAAEAKKNRKNVNKTQQKLITFQKRANDMLAMLMGTPDENGQQPQQQWRSIKWYINNIIMNTNKQKMELEKMATMTSDYIRKNSGITMTDGGMNQPPQNPKTMTNVG